MGSIVKRIVGPLAVFGVAAGAVRLLLPTLIPALLRGAPIPPAVITHTTTVVTNLTETLAVLAGLALYFRWTRGQAHPDSFAQVGLDATGAHWLGLGLLASLAGVLSSAGLALVTGYMPALRVIYPGIWPVLLASAAAIHAGVIEELIFRGFLLRGIEAAWNRTGAIVVTAVIFVLLHLAAPFRLSAGWWGVVTVGGFGLAWSYYAARRSLWLPIGLHIGFDLWVFLLFGLPGITRGAILWLESGGPAVTSARGGWALLLAALLTAAVLALVLAARRRASMTSR